MKKIIIASILVFAVSQSSFLFAVDWSAKKAAVKSEDLKDGEKIFIITDDNGKDFMLKYTSEITDKQADAILNLNKGFYTWKYMKVKQISFTITNDLIEVNVIPASFTYKNQNFMPHLPSGMLFSYADSLVYNFRISKSNYFVRINNNMSTEEALCENIAEVLLNPLEYLRKREPEFIFRKLTQLEEELASTNEKLDKLTYGVLGIHNTGFLGFGNNLIDKNAIAKVVELKKGNPALKKKEIAAILEKEKIELSNQEIELILNVYFNEFD